MELTQSTDATICYATSPLEIKHLKRRQMNQLFNTGIREVGGTTILIQDSKLAQASESFGFGVIESSNKKDFGGWRQRLNVGNGTDTCHRFFRLPRCWNHRRIRAAV